MEYLHKHYPGATYLFSPYKGYSGYTRSGYGKRLPTDWVVRIGKRLHRVRAICFSNAGTLWVRVRGQQLVFECCYHQEEK